MAKCGCKPSPPSGAVPSEPDFAGTALKNGRRLTSHRKLQRHLTPQALCISESGLVVPLDQGGQMRHGRRLRTAPVPWLRLGLRHLKTSLRAAPVLWCRPQGLESQLLKAYGARARAGTARQPAVGPFCGPASMLLPCKMHVIHVCLGAGHRYALCAACLAGASLVASRAPPRLPDVAPQLSSPAHASGPLRCGRIFSPRHHVRLW